MKQKTLLIIAYDYSPNGITSSRRPGGMAKYLSEFGWRPIVLTRQWTRDNCNYDESIVPNLDPGIKKYEVTLTDAAMSTVRATFYRFFFPGLHPVAFVDEGKKAIDRILDENAIDAIWTTAPPANVLSLGRYAARRSGKPWVADFRDVWQWIPGWFVRLTLPLRFWHERRALQYADAITTVSAGFAATLRERNHRDAEVVSHGYDEEINAGHTLSKITCFNIVYTGGLTLGNPNLRPLLDAIALLDQRRQVDVADISVDFYGKGNDAHLQSMFSGHALQHLVRNHGPVSREAIIQLQREAAILLVASHPGMPGWLTSKMIEYIVSGRPILSVPRDDDCIDALLAETRTGVSCSSAEDIAAQILDWYREWKASGTVQLRNPDRGAIDAHSARRQAQKLAVLLDGLVKVDD